MLTVVRILLLSLLFLLRTEYSIAQPAERKNTPQDYIAKYKEDAIREMHQYGVPASITLAQGMLESDNGNSALAVYANNHFGIKCHKEWSGATYHQDDDEKNECFRKYNSAYESFIDHSSFLRTRPRYAGLFELQMTDYKGWATGLKAAGYATDPKYADRLIDIIERYKLFEYDKSEGIAPTVVKPKPQQGQVVVNPTAQRRQVMTMNHVKYVVVKPGDSFFKIAQELDMEVRQLYRYNEMGKDAILKPGQTLYIQPKKKRSATGTHLVKPGETMHVISQLYGVKVKYLYRYNNMQTGTEPKAGQEIKLNAKRR